MQLFKNNASSSLAFGVNATDNTLVLAAGEGNRFPSPVGVEFFLLTLTQGVGLELSWEIVKCTARSGDSLTVARAQEGSVGLDWAAGSKADLRVTAGTLGYSSSWAGITNKPAVIAAGASAAAARYAIGAGLGDVTEGGYQTLTNKTLMGYTETVYDFSGSDIGVTNGTIQTTTLYGNTTFTSSLTDGQSVILGITTNAFSVTWPSITWTKVGGGGVAPALTSSGVNWIVLWQVDGVIRGSFMGTA